MSPLAPESPGTAAVGPSAPVPPMTSPVVGEEVEEEPARETPLRLILKVNEPCWLEVHGDGDIVAQGLMLRGFEKEIQAREEIRLWLGNAGGVSIWINERPGISLGRPGQVRKDLRITPANFMEFVASEEAPQVLPLSGERAGARG